MQIIEIISPSCQEADMKNSINICWFIFYFFFKNTLVAKNSFQISLLVALFIVQEEIQFSERLMLTGDK